MCLCISREPVFFYRRDQVRKIDLNCIRKVRLIREELDRLRGVKSWDKLSRETTAGECKIVQGLLNGSWDLPSYGSNTSHGTWCEIQKQLFFRNSRAARPLCEACRAEGLSKLCQNWAQHSLTPRGLYFHGDNSWLLIHATFVPGSMPGALLAVSPVL